MPNDPAENLRWQLERESGLRVQMAERLGAAERVVAGLREELRVAHHGLKKLALRDEGAVASLRAKNKQLADSLKSENATRARLEKVESELAEALSMKGKALAKCTVLQTERDEARAEVAEADDLLRLACSTRIPRDR